MTSSVDRAALQVRALHASVDRDPGAVVDAYTDDVKAWTPALSADSLSELLAQYEQRDDAFSEVDLDVVPLDVQGDYACVEWSVAMTHSGPLVMAEGRTVDASGIRVTLHGVTVAEFRGERICALRQYWDELSVFEQLGLLPRDVD